MTLRPSVTDRPLDLPPPYSLVPLREVGDAFAHACRIAGEKGAGTLVWVRRYDLAEFAVVLEPDQPLAEARLAHYVGMNALADTLIVHAPPKKPVLFDWPDALRVDGVMVGGGRLGWPDGADEDEPPPWMVFAGMIRTSAVRAGEPGTRPQFGGLDELGFQEIDSGDIVSSFARHLMVGFHEWGEDGFSGCGRRWLDRLDIGKGPPPRLAENGDLLIGEGKRRALAPALASPSWLDPATGAPWL
ncbi:biotin/lipoate--protein ligase family protein [Inquilinus sp. CAU 1745]|uniref:biotin/lipoate--protein ligase family protein n=1 Tax=Inquilinus sp. CAU 1745 TaxID=3140369 RepID=UPI00325A813E